MQWKVIFLNKSLSKIFESCQAQNLLLRLIRLQIIKYPNSANKLEPPFSEEND